MKLRYKIIIVFVAIIFGVLIGFGFFKIFNHEQETNVNEKTQLSKYFLEYFNDTLEEEVSVEALIDNGYIRILMKINVIYMKLMITKLVKKKLIVKKLKKLQKDL